MSPRRYHHGTFRHFQGVLKAGVGRFRKTVAGFPNAVTDKSFALVEQGNLCPGRPHIGAGVYPLLCHLILKKKAVFYS
jgi:hypothetical protein